MGIEEKPRKTLLGVLASKFSDQKENLATEALLHIINSSKASKSAFMDFLKQTSWKSDENLSFKSQEQSADDDSIPDMIGTNPDGDRLVIIENKFWAGLTDNQPNTYVNQLPDGGLLMFVAPSMRLPTIWSEIKRRAIENGQTLDQDKIITTDLIEARNGKVFLAVTSWRCLLNFLCDRMRTAADLDTVSDIKQLIGLCDEQDSDAFVPLRSEDLSPWIAKRLNDFYKIIDRSIEKLTLSKLYKSKDMKFKKRNRRGFYCMDFIYNEKYYCGLYFFTDFWIKQRETPIWLFIYQNIDKDNRPGLTLKQKDNLSSLEHENPSRLLVFDDEVDVPIFLPIGVEFEQVTDSVINQIKGVLGLLP